MRAIEKAEQLLYPNFAAGLDTSLRLTFAEQPAKPAVPVSDHFIAAIGHVHVIAVVPAFGDYYGTCGCGARSLPISSPGLAATWKCPRAEAEYDVAIAEKCWQQRVADAHLIER